MAKILLKFKEAAIKEVVIDKDVITVGRKPTNDIHVDNLAVSGVHAKVFKKDDQYYIEDLSSLNGTFVNGRKISVHALHDADVIIIGKHTLNFISDKPEDAKAPSPSKDRDLLDETILIDAKVKDQILSKGAPKSSEQTQTATGKDVVGGFMVIEGSTDKTEYDLVDRITTIGKDASAGIKLKGLFAPKIAALVNRRKDGYTVSSSTGGKGIKVNGKDVEGQHKLQEGDIVEVSSLKLQFFLKE
ncbi:FHA domain-containing protein [Candidatus Magnetomonas plexicatena]|uniref:FHA domain-containing protein n=1 Tax=Candidatus Magnetomonas plexicatena TaxID=2552947 RepID=UPI001C768161|nr:FHA domain-containing protein [Nitrospirales bacterium LBB_01]